MIDWIEVTDSTRVTAVAYDEEGERILVRLKNGPEWQYEGCPRFVWEEFMAIGVSKGGFIHDRLNHHTHGRLQ